MNLIAIAGQMMTGKTTVANYLAKKLNWQKISFADGVKKVFMDNFNVNQEFIDKYKRDFNVPKGFLKNCRNSLQFIGEGFRTIKDDVWINLALKDPNNKIIDDCRYINEAKAVKEIGGITIIIKRPGFENNDPHPSEREIRDVIKDFPNNPYFDHLVINDGSLENLYSKFDELLH